MKDKNKKKNKVLKGFIITICLVAVIIVSLGFIFPGLFWRVPLGIKTTAVDYKTANEKFNQIKDAINNKEAIDIEFTSEELTAYMNENKFHFLPLENGEIRINADKTIEISAKVNKKVFLEDILEGDYTKEEIEAEIPALGILPNKVNIYIHFSGNVANNIINLDLHKITVQGVTIPESYYNTNNLITRVIDLLDDVIEDYTKDNDIIFKYIESVDSKIKVRIETK